MIRKSIAVLLVAAGVVLAGYGEGSNAEPETKAVEAAIMKDFGVTGEELVIAFAVESNPSSNYELIEGVVYFAMQDDKEKALSLEILRCQFAAKDKNEVAGLTGQAKMISKIWGKDIAERKAALEKLYKEATSNDNLAKVNNLYVMKTEVTQGLYCIVNFCENPSNFKGNDRRPVENVSWYDAVSFCNRLSEMQGLKPCYSVNGRTVLWGTAGKEYRDYDVEVDTSANGWRLPTEAEWLAAADDGHTCSGSDNIDEVAWYTKNSDGHPQKVGTKAANAKSLYDMSGNVWEWCWDKDGSCRVDRGGSYNSNGNSCSVSSRSSIKPDSKYSDVGFRVVRNAN